MKRKEWTVDDATVIEAQNKQIRNQAEEIKELTEQLTNEKNKTRIAEIIEATETTDNKDAIIQALENNLRERNTEIRELKERINQPSSQLYS